jgi:hypothetical protein
MTSVTYGMRKSLCKVRFDMYQGASISINMVVCMCVCVCMFEHNSGTPGAISTKLGTHIAIWMWKNLMYVFHILRREDGVGGRKF